MFIFHVHIYHDDQSERCSKQSEQHDENHGNINQYSILVMYWSLNIYCLSLIWIIVKDEMSF